MRYGYCTGFATPVKDRVDEELVRAIAEAGYDYAEFPLMLTASLPDAAFERLARLLGELGLGADASCNMFPPSIRVTGPDADDGRTRAYLEGALFRLSRLGTRVLVFGSTGARNLPAGFSPEEGYAQLTDMLRDNALPLLRKYDITLVMEPIGGYEANFIKTLPDGMEVVRRVGDERVKLLMDTVHVLYEREDPNDIDRFAEYLCHVHVCEAERALPLDGFSPELRAALDHLKAAGYDRRISFEPMPYGPADMKKALENIKRFMV